MSRPTIVLTTCLFSLGALGIGAACGGSDTTDPCLPRINGLVAYYPGIDLLVRDAAGHGQALGDTAITYRGSDSVITTAFDTLHLQAGFGAPGTYAVRLKRKFYRETVIPGVVVNSGICGGPVVTVVPVTLALVSGAPALRSVAVLGAEFLYAPRAQSQLVARFDADPSVPTTVTWRLSDSTAARVDAGGLVTAKCPVPTSVIDTVTAIATADTMVKGRAVFSIAQQTTCP